MSMIFDPKEELDHIAEFADSGVRVFQRQGSLVGIPGTYGLKKWLYHKWRNRGNAVYTFVGSLVAIGRAACGRTSSSSRSCSRASAPPRS